jgi:hypothetical protein
MGKLWKTIGTVVPGPTVLLAGKWIDLFSATHLTYPDWQEGADLIALAVAAVVAVVLSIALKDTSKALLKALIWIGLILVLAGLATCWAIWFHLAHRCSPLTRAGFKMCGRASISSRWSSSSPRSPSARCRCGRTNRRPSGHWRSAPSSCWLLQARSGSFGGDRPALVWTS